MSQCPRFLSQCGEDSNGSTSKPTDLVTAARPVCRRSPATRFRWWAVERSARGWMRSRRRGPEAEGDGLWCDGPAAGPRTSARPAGAAAPQRADRRRFTTPRRRRGRPDPGRGRLRRGRPWHPRRQSADRTRHPGPRPALPGCPARGPEHRRYRDGRGAAGTGTPDAWKRGPAPSAAPRSALGASQATNTGPRPSYTSNRPGRHGQTPAETSRKACQDTATRRNMSSRARNACRGASVGT